MILSYSTHHEDPLHSCLNMVCSQAIRYNKRRFVVALIKRGSTPPPNQLLQVSGVFDDPCVQNYLETVSAAMLDKEYETQEGDEEIEHDSFHEVCQCMAMKMYRRWQNVCMRGGKNTVHAVATL